MIEYFVQLMDALESLERSIFRINDLKREFEYGVNKLINRQALIACLVLPVVLLVGYVIGGSGLVGSSVQSTQASTAFIRMFGAGFITWTLGIMLNMIFKYLWYRDYLPAGKKVKQRKLFPKFETQKVQIIQETEGNVTTDIFEKVPLEKEYLKIPTVDMLMTYLKEGKAHDLAEALELYKSLPSNAQFSSSASVVERFEQAKKEEFLLEESESN
ncbi:hypothetical protein ACFO26_05745 [Lactococcus nasutitermitis]|uniref:Uncharacterized protein n=1 Tax=Lactococcus nasutitermitis TaxID=1652957 RepID=A0ABV9JCB2_9LACT|nr:hypothetical protein [Lactococcus nasutitermitis]